MGHDNGGWMNSDQRDAMKAAGEERVRSACQSNAPLRRYAFAQISEQDGRPVMHVSFNKLPGEEKHINIAMSIYDARDLRDALIRQCG